MKKHFSKTRHGKKSGPISLKIAALFEGAKGLIVLLVGCGALSYIHKDLNAAAAELVRHIHLNPASHYPQVFLDLAAKTSDAGLLAMAAAAVTYAVIRLAEAVGLWLDRRWAEWFGILTGAIYIPVEVYELTRSVTWPKVTVLAINVAVVLYLLLHILADRLKK